MCSEKNEKTTPKPVSDFTFPKLHKGKQWYVDFFAWDPMAGKLRRKKYMLDRMKSSKSREQMASVLIARLYAKLLSGWSPFATTVDVRMYTELSTVIERYKEYVETSRRKGTLKPKSCTDYLNRLRSFENYLKQTKYKIKYSHQLDTPFVISYLDHLIYDRDVNARTRNNHKLWLSTFCIWMKERKYIDTNPTEPIHMMKEGDKIREPLTEVALVRLRDYLRKENPPFYLACMMEYYTFIRPDELRYIKIGDINLAEQTIYVSPEVAKNRKGQKVAVNDAVLKIMIEQEVFSHPDTDYLFGYRLTPGPRQANIKKMQNVWRQVRRVLRFPKSYQFYSLKDSGIRDLANSAGIVYARDQARHTDISITNKYLKTTNIVHDEAKHFKGTL